MIFGPQNIVERMETPEAFEKMISREEECEAQGRESRLRDVLKKEWPVDEKGERIYQITNIYEEKAEELLIVELYTRHPPGKRSPVRAFYAVSLRGAGRMETQRNADDGISAESVNEKAKQGGQEKQKLSSCFCCGGDTVESQESIRPLSHR